MKELSIEEQVTNYKTLEHIRYVSNLLNYVCIELMRRSYTHDNSKLNSPELEVFTEYTSKLENISYGSEEYKENLKLLGKGLDHHYEHNKHHPEFIQYNKEEWKAINGYEGIYEVSNLGQVRSLDRVCKRNSDTGDVFKKGKLRKPHLTPKGYLRLQLKNKDGIASNHLVHRLVAQAFLPIPDQEQIEINHKDGNKQNNNFDNLEWCSGVDNLQHSYDIGLRNGKQLKYIVHCNELDITTYGVTKMEEALIVRGYEKARASAILACLNGTSNHHLGLTFTSENIEEPKDFSYVNYMTLFDVIEMIIDWYAATKRHKDGDIYKSLDINKEKFNIDNQLHNILLNTVKYIETKQFQCFSNYKTQKDLDDYLTYS